MTARRFVVAFAFVLTLGAASAASAASPASGTVSDSSRSVSWQGASYVAGTVPSAAACTASLCDHYSLNVSVASSYWDSHSGSVTVAISWPDASDNFDLYVSGHGGTRSSARSGTRTEAVTLTEPYGTYSVTVVPALVTSSGYSGSATLSAVATPPPTTTPPPDGGGGNNPPPGGGGGSTNNGGGSGSTGGGPGAGGSPGGTFGSQGGGPTSFGGGYGPTTFYPNSVGGNISYFAPPQTTVTQDVTFQPVYAAVPTQQTPALATPVGATVPRMPQYLWLLLPLTLFVVAAVTYVLFEPEERPAVALAGGGAVVSDEDRVPPLALAGLMVWSIAGVARVLAWGGRTAWSAIARRRLAEPEVDDDDDV